MADVERVQHRPEPPDLPGDYHRLVCQHAGVALIATDTDLRIRVWSSTATQLFGASAAQMIGTSVLSVVPADQRDLAERLLRRAIQDRETGQLEFSLQDSTGDRRDLAVAISPIVDDQGVALGASTWLRDITRRVELTRQVGLGRKMAALGKMAGTLAHHFNNILGGVVTSVDFALGADDPAVEHRVLRQTARSLARASRLVDSLLAFAEGAHRESDLGDLTEMVLQAIDVVEPELADAKVHLELDLRAIPVTAVPRGPMITVVFNLVHNAVEAMPDGGTLRIELLESGGGCLLRFADSGCGMTEECLDRVFEPFYSTKPVPANQEERAPGFGLAVVHAIVQEVGGKISVASEVGKGTTFEVWIPSGLDAIDPQQPEEPSQSPSPTGSGTDS